MLVADLDTSIHGLTGHIGVLDELMRLLADDLVYGAVVVLGVLWFHRQGLRAGLAVAVGALLALALGQLLGSLFPESRPFISDHFTPLVAHAADGSFPSDDLLVLGAVVGGCLVASRPLATGRQHRSLRRVCVCRHSKDPKSCDLRLYSAEAIRSTLGEPWSVVPEPC